MIDIHPPEHTPHTWRDFFIHMMTICLGLVIAIALEQAVEALHRVHERNALIAAMCQEAQGNVPILEHDIHNLENASQVMFSYVAALRQAKPINGMVTVTLPLKSSGRIGRIPLRAVWTVAIANGNVALLPEDRAEVYSRLDFEAQETLKGQEKWMNSLQDMQAIEGRLGQRVHSGATLHLTIAEREELSRTLSRAAASFDWAGVWAANWLGADDAVLKGVRNPSQMDAYMDHRQAQLAND